MKKGNNNIDAFLEAAGVSLTPRGDVTPGRLGQRTIQQESIVHTRRARHKGQHNTI